MSALMKVSLVLACMFPTGCGVEQDPRRTLPNPELGLLSPAQRELLSQAIQPLKHPEALGLDEEAKAWFTLGKTYHGLEILPAATACYENGLALRSDEPQVHYLLGLALQELARPEEAIHHFQSTLRSQPDYVPNLLSMAEYYFRATNYPESVALFKKVLSLQPNHAVALAGMASLALEQQNYQQALDWAQKGRALFPEVSRFHYLAAMASRGMNNLEQAETFFQLSQDSPKSLPMEDPYYQPVLDIATRAKGLLEQGSAAEANGFFDRAEAFYKEAAAWQPQLTEPLYQIARLKHRLGQNEDAIQILEPLLQAHPDQALIWQLAGQVNDALGQIERAKLAYQELVKLGLDTPGYVLEAGDFLRRHQNFVEALNLYQQASERHPTQMQVRMGQILMLIHQDRTGQALSELEHLLKQPRVPPPFYLLLARLLATHPDAKLRDGKRAFSMVEGLVELGVNIDLLETGAMALAEMDDFPKAIDWQNAAIQLSSKSLDRKATSRLTDRLNLYRKGQKIRKPFPHDDPIFIKPLR